MLFINDKSKEALLYDVHIFLIKPITIKDYTIFFYRTDDKFSTVGGKI